MHICLPAPDPAGIRYTVAVRQGGGAPSAVVELAANPSEDTVATPVGITAKYNPEERLIALSWEGISDANLIGQVAFLYSLRFTLFCVCVCVCVCLSIYLSLTLSRTPHADTRTHTSGPVASLRCVCAALISFGCTALGTGLLAHSAEQVPDPWHPGAAVCVVSGTRRHRQRRECR